MRVVISGMGVISALGLDQEGFWQSLASGRSGIGPIPENVGPVPEMGMSQVRFKNGAAVLGYDAETYFPRKTLSFMDRFAQFSVIAAREAVAAAGIEWTEELRESAAIITGSCMGGRFTDEIGYWELFHHGRHRVHPLTIPLGNEQRRRQPYLHGIRPARAGVYLLNRLFLVGSCHRQRALDGAFRSCAPGDCRGK